MKKAYIIPQSSAMQLSGSELLQAGSVLRNDYGDNFTIEFSEDTYGGEAATKSFHNYVNWDDAE